MSYKPTDTFITSNANGYFSDDSSGAAKSYKVSITKPTRYPGEETTNGIIWLLDLDAFSNLPRNLNSNGQHPVQDLVGRDWEKDPTQAHPGTFFPTKNNYYIFASIFDFPDKNPKNGSELHDPSNDVSTRDGVKLIRLDLGSSLSRVGYGELKSTYTIDELLNLVLDYMRNIYIDIIYGRRTSTKWIEATKEGSGLSNEEIIKIYNDIGNLEENKVSFFIDSDEPVDITTGSQSVVQNTSDSKSSELKNIIFNVQKEGIFSNAKFGELRLIGESLVNENPGFDFGDEDDLSDLLLEDEFREVAFQAGEEIFTNLKEVDDARNDGDSQSSPDSPLNLDREQEPNNTPGAGTGVKSTGTYTSELPKESGKSGPNGDYAIKYGFNGVPYYGQWDNRWRDVVYGLWTGPANEKDFVELNMEDKSVWKRIKYPNAGHGSPSNPNIKTEWRNKTFSVKFDGQNGSNGFSSIFGGGCGITSFSMVINYWMIKLKKDTYTSPIKIAKLACDTGARSKTVAPNGTQPNSGFFKKIKEVFGLNVSTCKYDEAVSLVKSGTPVIMCGTWKGFRGDGSVKDQTGGHFIVITGYESSTKRFRVNDPGSARSTYYFQNSLPKLSFWKVTV